MKPVPIRAAAAAFVGLAATAAPAVAQIRDAPNEYPGVADIPVIYTEAMAGHCELPPLLTLEDGEAVTTAEAWRDRRRAEVFELVERSQFGRAPGRSETMSFDVFDEGTPAFDGRAVRRQVTIYFTDNRDEHYLDLLIYTPADAKGPVPLLLAIGWVPNNLAVDDPGVKPGRRWNRETNSRVEAGNGRRGFGQIDPRVAIERGYGIATFHYNDVEPDALGGFEQSIRAAYTDGGEPAGDEWGAIAAWAWGVSRVIDYFETDPLVDETRVAVTGASRLGKTALWAGASDERIACVLASVSGAGGAALSRRNYGERIAHLIAPTRFPYWFASDLKQWAGRMDEAPWDSHMILSLIAPRPLLLHTGDQDRFSDPYGEWLAAREASAVYELLGETGLPQFEFPQADEFLPTRLGWFMHEGGHGVPPTVWPRLYDFMDVHLREPTPDSLTD